MGGKKSKTKQFELKLWTLINTVIDIGKFADEIT